MSNDINFGGILETLNDKSDRDLQNTLGGGVLDYVVEAQTFEDGSWYRKYKSGWLEQGGIVNVSYSNTSAAVSLFKPFMDTKYNIIVAMGGHTENGVGNANWQGKTTTAFVIWGDYTNSTATNVPTTWEAKGQGQ